MPLLARLTEAAILARQATSSAIAVSTSAVVSAAATAVATTAASTSATDNSADVSFVSGTFEPFNTAATPSYSTGSSATNASSASSSTSTSSSGSGGGGSSPLLFFVALGFGVVFTNLWIIVGVKYCFRYNARVRALREAAENGEPITLENMPRQHRRRREKKLMTIDEVNEKFPMMKYKSWVASRARDGLSTYGGVDAPTRPNSIRSVDGAIVQHKERESSDDSEERTKQDKVTTIATASAVDNDDALTQTATVVTLESTDLEAASSAKPINGKADDEHDEHDEHSDDGHHSDDDEHIIDAALPPECIGTAGDTCAICIDTLEDDDDVRGLTCGHAFHAVCLDPWLTSRRACCPLCKADYYIPKPRPTPQEAAAAAQAAGLNGSDGRRRRIIIPSRPATAWINIRTMGRSPTHSGTDGSPMSPLALGPGSVSPGAQPVSPASVPSRGLFGRRRAMSQPMPPAQEPVEGSALIRTTTSRGNWFRNLRSNFPRRQSINRVQSHASGNAGSAVQMTPSQMEAGARIEAR